MRTLSPRERTCPKSIRSNCQLDPAPLTPQYNSFSLLNHVCLFFSYHLHGISPALSPYRSLKGSLCLLIQTFIHLIIQQIIHWIPTIGQAKVIAVGDVVVNKTDKVFDLVMVIFYKMHRKFMLPFSIFSNQTETYNYDLFISPDPSMMMGKQNES